VKGILSEKEEKKGEEEGKRTGREISC